MLICWWVGLIPGHSCLQGPGCPEACVGLLVVGPRASAGLLVGGLGLQAVGLLFPGARPLPCCLQAVGKGQGWVLRLIG